MLINPRERYIREEALKRGKEEGKKEGKYEGKLEVARALLNKGYPIDKLVELSGLSKDEILNSK